MSARRRRTLAEMRAREEALDRALAAERAAYLAALERECAGPAPQTDVVRVALADVGVSGLLWGDET